jgi:predicted NUDIX family NTP pyrophosphohydrolase
MPRISAGLLMYRIRDNAIQVLLVHPGGPFWKNRDEGAWSIPKGEPEADEELLDCAQREFEEELGLKPHGPYLPLDPIQQKGGKIVHAWAFEGNCDPSAIRSNTFAVEWPPRSGRFRSYPEVDRAEFFDLDTGRKKINQAQAALLDQLEQQITGGRD